MNKLSDNDIREALRRSEEKRTAPTVPDDFFDSVMGRIEAEPKTIKLWRWVAAAACIALVAGIGSAILFADKTVVESTPIAETVIPEDPEKQPTDIAETDSVAEPVVVPEPKIEAPKTKATPAAKPKPAPQPAPNPNLRMERPAYAANEPATDNCVSANSSASQKFAQPNLAETQTETGETDFTPAMLDEFIEVLAEFQGVNKINSECSISNDSSFVETFYVFPVKEEFDVLWQFVQMVGNYSSASPGYFYNNTERQIFFSIDDEQNGLNYFWIAEQIDDSKIMIYSVHAPIDIEYESDCYQQLHDDLTFSNFNTYY